LIRFFTDGTIQVRNAGAYAADITLAYSPGTMYHFRVPVNIASHTYSVYVKASGGSEQLLASNYAYRTEQSGVTALSNDGIIVDTATGSLRFGNFAVTTYNAAVLADGPVAFWNVNPTGNNEIDLTGNGNTGIYVNGSSGISTMPNGDQVAVFDGATQYVKVPSNGTFSVQTTKNLTWEMWIQPEVLDFPNSDPVGYVNVMCKCISHPDTGLCEWQARMYDTDTPGENPPRPNRMSAYIFNPDGREGAAADWQPVPHLIQAGQWYYLVGEYTTDPSQTPHGCDPSYPGAINVWVNGVLWNETAHFPTGCMSQGSGSGINVTPVTTSSPFNIGTVDLQSWFKGAIGKVAIYDKLLTQDQITNRYQIMTGKQPTGNCNQSGGTCTF